MNEATLAYVRQHADDDVRQLALRGSKDAAVNMTEALQQIAGRDRAQQWIADHPLDILAPQGCMEGLQESLAPIAHRHLHQLSAAAGALYTLRRSLISLL